MAPGFIITNHSWEYSKTWEWILKIIVIRDTLPTCRYTIGRYSISYVNFVTKVSGTAIKKGICTFENYNYIYFFFFEITNN